MKILNSVDFTKNQAYNFVLESGIGQVAPVYGQIRLNDQNGKPEYWDNTTWKNFSGIQADNVSIVIDEFGGYIGVKFGGIATVYLANDAVTDEKLASNSVTTIKLVDKNITFSKIQDMAIMTVLGSISGGTPTEIQILNEIDLISNSQTALATQASIKAYVDASIVALGSLIGGLDVASITEFPSGTSVKKGNYWYATSAGTVAGKTLNIGDVVTATKNNPTGTDPNDYIFLETNRDQATTTVLGLVKLATEAEVQEGTDTTKAITPAGLQAKVSTEIAKGIVQLATNAEVIAGTENSKAVTPAGIKALFDASTGKATALIGDGAGTVFGIAHTLGIDIICQLNEVVSGKIALADIAVFADHIDVIFGFAPGLNQYKVVISKA
jgi:hypothetical protein